MKKLIIILLLLITTITVNAQNKLPKILNPGDSLKVTSKVWVQSIDSEIDQRITIKRTQEKLSDYIKKTKEIEVLQDSIQKKTEVKNALLEKGLTERDQVIQKLSKQIDESYAEVFVLRKEVVDLQKHLEKSEKQKSFWKKVGMTSTAVLIGIIGLKVL